MKISKYACLIVCAGILLGLACNTKKQLPKINNTAPLAALETGFVTIPDSVQTSIYWYWISDNISKEGVIKDLESMKKVGINRAFIGNIWQDDVPAGKVKIFTPEWWEVLHAALKKATELNIEIGIFNSPGWSQSGGPWVKPQQAMRYLTSSKTNVKGPLKFNGKLNTPDAQFQDVKVIAYPVTKEATINLKDLAPKLNTTPVIDGINKITDGDDATGIVFNKNVPYTVDITLAKPTTFRSLVIVPARQRMTLEGDVQVKTNGVYKNIKHFIVDRSNSELNVGFKPYGQAAISIPTTTAANFRLVFTKFSDRAGIAEVNVSALSMVDSYYAEKTSRQNVPNTACLTGKPTNGRPQPVIDKSCAMAIDPGKVVDISEHMQYRWHIAMGRARGQLGH
jgi:hypothetical protein